jgi:hypothetical protein
MSKQVTAYRNDNGHLVLMSDGHVLSSMVESVSCSTYNSVIIMSELFSLDMPEMLVQLYKKVEFDFALLVLDSIVRSILENKINVVDVHYNQALLAMTSDLLDPLLNFEYYVEFRSIISLTWKRCVAQRQVLLKPNVKYGEQVCSINYFAITIYRTSIRKTFTDCAIRRQFKQTHEETFHSPLLQANAASQSDIAILSFILMSEQLAKVPDDWILTRYIDEQKCIDPNDTPFLCQLNMDTRRLIHHVLTRLDDNPMGRDKNAMRDANGFDLTATDKGMLTKKSTFCARLRAFLLYMMLEEKSYSIALTKKNAVTHDVQTYNMSLADRMARHARLSQEAVSKYYFNYKR